MGVIASKVGKRGTVVIPARLRKRFGLVEGDFVVAEERAEGVLIPAGRGRSRGDLYLQRRAEFLLNNAVDREDYRRARAEVKRLGLNPDKIEHRKLARS